MRSFPRSCRFGSPSRKRMRSIKRSACFISSIDSFFSYSSSFFSPQLPNMRAWRKYWLIAVSSLNSTLFKCCTTFASPFIAPPQGRWIRRRTPAGVKEAAGNEKKKRSGREGQRLVCLRVAQDFARAVAAAPATGADAELGRELVQRTGTLARPFAHSGFGDCVADADVQGGSVEKYYHLKPINKSSC